MGATFLIGGRAYALDDTGAAWLFGWLRSWSHVDELDHESWPAGADAIKLKRAELVTEAMSDDDEGPIELGLYDAQMLTTAITTKSELSGDPGLEALYDAARRLADDWPLDALASARPCRSSPVHVEVASWITRCKELGPRSPGHGTIWTRSISRRQPSSKATR